MDSITFNWPGTIANENGCTVKSVRNVQRILAAREGFAVGRGAASGQPSRCNQAKLTPRGLRYHLKVELYWPDTGNDGLNSGRALRAVR